MAWIESHQSLRMHPKTLRASQLLKKSVPTTIGHLHCLWWWAMDYAQSGDLTPFTASEIARAADWTGNPEQFVDALCQVGFLDWTDNGGRVLHEWYDYAGKLIDRRAANRDRMQHARAAHVQRTCSARAAHVQHPCETRVELPYPTVPNRTQPNSTNKENKEKSAQHALELPEFVNPDTWKAFLDMRVKIRSPATLRAQELIIKTLTALKAEGQDPNRCLEQSTVNNWKDVYAVKPNGGKPISGRSQDNGQLQQTHGRDTNTGSSQEPGATVRPGPFAAYRGDTIADSGDEEAELPRPAGAGAGAGT